MKNACEFCGLTRTKPIWIVTREWNLYDQMGSYFVAAYFEKPTFQELKELIKEDDVTVGKLTRGGGRQKWEDDWYNLEEVKSGENHG